jgi:hypothetical protein
MKSEGSELDLAESAGTLLGPRTSLPWQEFLQETFGQLTPTNPEFMSLIADLGLRMATTNYDTLIEESIGQRPVTTLHEWMKSVGDAKSKAIFHIHGIYTEPEYVVWSRSDYKNLLTDKLRQYFQNRLAEGGLIFIGCGGTLDDPNFEEWRRFLSALKPLGIPAYRLYCDRDKYSNSDCYIPVRYGSRYSDLEKYLKLLSPNLFRPGISQDRPWTAVPILEITGGSDDEEWQAIYRLGKLPVFSVNNIVGDRRGAEIIGDHGEHYLRQGQFSPDNVDADLRSALHWLQFEALSREDLASADRTMTLDKALILLHGLEKIDKLKARHLWVDANIYHLNNFTEDIDFEFEETGAYRGEHRLQSLLKRASSGGGVSYHQMREIRSNWRYHLDSYPVISTRPSLRSLGLRSDWDRSEWEEDRDFWVDPDGYIDDDDYLES